MAANRSRRTPTQQEDRLAPAVGPLQLGLPMLSGMQSNVGEMKVQVCGWGSAVPTVPTTGFLQAQVATSGY